MTILIVAVVLVGALCVFDLLLTFAVLRRLREHTAELSRLAARPGFGGPQYDPGVLVGRTLPEPAAGIGNQPQVVGIFDANCSACHEHAPQLVAEGTRHAVLAVVTGDGPGADDLIGLLADVPTLTGEDAGQVAKALDIQAFPTFLRVGKDGTIVKAQAGPLDDMADAATV